MKRSKRPTAAITQEVVRLLRAGVPIETAAKVVLGSKWDDLFRWLLIGAGEDKSYVRVPKPFKVFHDEVTKAQATAEVRNVAVLQKSGSPRYALEWLKRRAPERWGVTDHTKITV